MRSSLELRNQLVYAVKAPGSGVWVYQTVPLASVAVKPDWVSIALDAANNPHFACTMLKGGASII